MKRIDDILLGCMIGCSVIDGFYLYAVNNYRLYTLIFFCSLLLGKAVIAWIEYYASIFS